MTTGFAIIMGALFVDRLLELREYQPGFRRWYRLLYPPAAATICAGLALSYPCPST